MNFPIRYIAQIIVEAETPLAIGSDSLLFDQDAPVEKDCNGLPYIPGTAIAGFLRHKLKGLSKLFGDEADSHSDQPLGSNIVISEAFLLDDAYKVHQKPENITNGFLLHYYNLPIRQHVAINAFGASKDSSLFDQEIAFKGSRFKFEIELQLKTEKDTEWKTILNAFYDNDFYIGSGQFNNFGELKVIEIKEKTFDLSKNLDTYLNLTVDLNEKFDIEKEYKYEVEDKYFQEKKINLSGENSFFHFGAGFGDDEVDFVNYKEKIIDWKNNKPKWETKYVIPGTSIKGALAHRVAYYHNNTEEQTIEKLIEECSKTIKSDFNEQYNIDNFIIGNTLEELAQQKETLEKAINALNKEKFDISKLIQNHTGVNNGGVKAFFGSAKSEKEKGNTGTVIIKDVYLDENTPEIIFMHNKIDRYTGGTIDSALYSEKVLAINKIDLLIKTKEEITEESCLGLALKDLKNGLLPVGGKVNKGHGIFNKINAKTDGSTKNH